MSHLTSELNHSQPRSRVPSPEVSKQIKRIPFIQTLLTQAPSSPSTHFQLYLSETTTRLVPGARLNSLNMTE